MDPFQDDSTNESCTNILWVYTVNVALLQDNMNVRYIVSKLTHLAIFCAKKPAPAFWKWLGFFGASWLFENDLAFWKWLGFLKWWCYRVRPRIITVVIFPPTFFVNSCSTLYSLSNVTFIVSWEHVLFELQLFDFFMEKWARKGMWPQIITVITFPPVFLFEFVFALHCICSLILPLLCHASRHSWSYG